MMSLNGQEAIDTAKQLTNSTHTWKATEPVYVLFPQGEKQTDHYLLISEPIRGGGVQKLHRITPELASKWSENNWTTKHPMPTPEELFEDNIKLRGCA